MAVEQNSLLEKLFGSRTRVKLLRLFFANAKNEYFVREISREIDEQINSVRRELANLEAVGILVSTNRDKKKYYTTDQNFVLFDELRSLILKSRLTLEKDFVKVIRTLGRIKYLALTGYFVNDQDSQVDIFLVGTVQRNKLKELVDQFHEIFGQQLRYTVMTPDEYQYRHDITDKFLFQIINSKKIILIDNMNSNRVS